MSINILRNYVEECLKNGVEPTFDGLNNYYRLKVLKNNNIF